MIRKILNKFFFFMAPCMLFGCIVERCGESNCYATLGVDFRSSSNIDSVRFYLNGDRICRSSLLINVVCRISVEDTFFSTMSIEADDSLLSIEDLSKQCIPSDGFPIWREFECRLDEVAFLHLDSSQLSIRVFSGETETIVSPNKVLLAGRRYRIPHNYMATQKHQDTIFTVNI